MRISWIELENIKSFASSTRVKLDAERNIIIGPNGSGKTTVLQALTAVMLTAMPMYSLATNSRGGRTNKTSLDQMPVNVSMLPPSFKSNRGAKQRASVCIDFRESIEVLRSELRNYSTIFEENLDEIILKFWDKDNIVTEIAGILDAMSSDSPHILTLNFVLDGQWINEVESRDTSGLRIAIREIESYRLIYEHLKRLGKTSLSICRGLQTVYIGADRASAFTDSMPLTGRNVGMDNPAANSPYIQRQQMTQQSLSNGSAFDFINHTLDRITESILYEKWGGAADPLSKIPEFLRIKRAIQDVLGLKFIADIPANPNEPMQYYFERDGDRVAFGQLSSGERSLILFMFAMANPDIENSLIIIDEAELHLHGHMQDILVDTILKNEGPSNQLIVSTHSPQLVNYRTATSIMRFSKDKSGNSMYKSFSDIISKENDYNILRLINSQNNESIFFADSIVLVEGITDRIVVSNLISAVSKSKKIIKVISVEGKTNFDLYREYLNKLEVDNCILADFDYLKNIAAPEVRALFASSDNKVNAKLRERGSRDGAALLQISKQVIATGDTRPLASLINDLESRRGLHLRDNLLESEKRLLASHIADLAMNERIHIVSYALLNDQQAATGEIEDYLRPLGFSKGKLVGISNYFLQEEFLLDFFTKIEKGQSIELLKLVCQAEYDDSSEATKTYTSIIGPTAP